MVLRTIPILGTATCCSVVGLSFENLLRLARGWPLLLDVPHGSLLVFSLPTNAELEEVVSLNLPEPEPEPEPESEPPRDDHR